MLRPQIDATTRAPVAASAGDGEVLGVEGIGVVGIVLLLIALAVVTRRRHRRDRRRLRSDLTDAEPPGRGAHPGYSDSP